VHSTNELEWIIPEDLDGTFTSVAIVAEFLDENLDVRDEVFAIARGTNKSELELRRAISDAVRSAIVGRSPKEGFLQSAVTSFLGELEDSDLTATVLATIRARDVGE